MKLVTRLVAGHPTQFWLIPVPSVVEVLAGLRDYQRTTPDFQRGKGHGRVKSKYKPKKGRDDWDGLEVWDF